MLKYLINDLTVLQMEKSNFFRRTLSVFRLASRRKLQEGFVFRTVFFAVHQDDQDKVHKEIFTLAPTKHKKIYGWMTSTHWLACEQLIWKITDFESLLHRKQWKIFIKIHEEIQFRR